MPHRIREKIKFIGRKFTIKDVTVRHDNGKEFTYEITERPGSIGSMIVAIDEKGRVLLVNEYMAGHDRMDLCLPKGRAEEGESAKNAAAREFEEETGYNAKKITHLMDVTLTPGYSNHKTALFLATGLTKAKNPRKGDEIEPLKIVFKPLDEAIRMAKKGKISEARAVLCLYMAREALSKSRK